MPKKSTVEIPLRKVEEIAAELQALAARPRVIKSYRGVFDQLHSAIEAVHHSGHPIEKAIEIVATRGGFDQEEVQREYDVYRARRVKRSKNGSSNGQPAGKVVGDLAPVNPMDKKQLRNV
jgi:hypothetical protein